jgi:hypothetical protein
MLTFENLHETFERLSKDNSTANVTFGKLMINDTQKNICGLADFTFLDDEWYCSSIDSQVAYRLPHNLVPGSVGNVYVINNSTKYFPTEIHSITDFDKLSSTSSLADSPEYYCIFNDCIYFYPYATDTSWEIHLKYRKKALEMTADDYTTGTVSVTQNTSVVTGSGTAFTAAMVGRWIKLSDGLWYEINLFSSATSLILTKTYEGATISGGSYVVGEIPIIPDGFQELLIYKPLEHYFMMTGEESRATFYKNLYDIGIRDLKSRFLSRSPNQVFRQGNIEVKNPNDYPSGLS